MKGENSKGDKEGNNEGRRARKEEEEGGGGGTMKEGRKGKEKEGKEG